MRKFIYAILPVLIFSLCACAEKPQENLLTENTSVTVPQAEPVSAPVDNAQAGADAQTFVKSEMSVREIFTMYLQAADKVKTYSAGFTRSYIRTAGENVIVGGSTALGSCIISLADENGIPVKHVAEEIIAEHGDALAVNSLFPIYGEEKGCFENGFSCISEAGCEENSEYIRLDMKFSECAGSGNTLASVLALDTLRSAGSEIIEMLGETAQTELFSEYSDCFLTCLIEKSTLRMVYLEQSISAENYVNVTTDMFVFADCRTQLLCPYKETVKFFDFDWN